MSLNNRWYRWVAGATLCFAVLCGVQAQAQCVYPITRQFGLNDGLAPVPTDPIPYNPAMPEFVARLNSQGIPPGILKTFDNNTSDRHMVATLRHGLRGCFSSATSLNLCFRARALFGGSDNDSVTIYNTDFGTYLFPVIYSSRIAPTLIPTWSAGTNATLCINLTTQMINNQIGDMLQLRVQDDTDVDFITMTLQ
jgi:hypothetical protein